MALSFQIPAPLTEISTVSLEWERLRTHLAGYASSPLGRDRVLALTPSSDALWIAAQHQRSAEIGQLLATGSSFEFHGLSDPGALLDKSRIQNAALAAEEIRDILTIAARVADWRGLILAPPEPLRGNWPAIEGLSAPLLPHDLGHLLRSLENKIEPDGSLSDEASPELRRIRRAMEQQQRAIEASLRSALRRLSDDGATQDELITIRGDRFVIPIKAEQRRRVSGVMHGTSSSGQTVYVEPLETIEQNNELIRLLDEELAEIHRILVAMTREIGAHSHAIAAGVEILAEVESHFARARFARALNCVRPHIGAPLPDPITKELPPPLSLQDARHPLLELRLRAQGGSIVPLTLELPHHARQLIISGPNTGGKTVALKTLGLLTLMAQAGIPIPCASAILPIVTAIYADIGDAQSIERDLSTFSAHITNVNHIARGADKDSLILLDELGSATDPEEGAALAVAVAEHFLHTQAWCFITTHLTALKIYAAKHSDGVVNAAVGFNEATLAPTYTLRLGVPGASAGINIAARIGLDPAIVANARAQMNTQTADIARFLDQLHAQLTAATDERETLRKKEQQLARDRNQLELEGKNEQRAKIRELEVKMNSLLRDFEYQIRETVKAVDDRVSAAKLSKEAERRIARLRREFSEQFGATVVAHTTGADKNDPAAQPHLPRHIAEGDTVKLRSLGKNARVTRRIDDKNYEVQMGIMKMRVSKDDIAEVVSSQNTEVRVATPLESARRRGGITVATSENTDYATSEINVIGRTADEAQDEVEKFLDRAFLAGLPRIRIVHGTGMGVLRRTLRDYLKKHPQVLEVTEPPYNEGGQGATLVELKL